MIYRRVAPSPPLSAFVQCLWYAEGFEGSHRQERLLPNGESGIVIDLRQSPIRIYNDKLPGSFAAFPGAIFCGARTDCFIIDTSEQERVIGVQFLPGGAYPFLPIPASEIANDTFALEEIWPGQASLLRERLLSASSIGAMFEVLAQTLLARLRQGSLPDPAMAFAIRELAAPASTRVADLASRIGFSSRRFMDLFRNQTGLTPKAFQRVRRFQYVLNALRDATPRSRNAPIEDWASLALRCGYYDQPHFIHDFRAFSGLTPSEYLSRATPHLNHVPLT